jgi:hypothetical protein
MSPCSTHKLKNHLLTLQTQHANFHKTNNTISHSAFCSATIYICGVAILINDHYESIMQFPTSKGVIEDKND